jgi:glycosyltransferase involved in cell wall biosynthesis
MSDPTDHPRAPSGFVTLDLVSLVVPVYNERDSLAALHAEISEVAAGLARRVEVIFIDDGSRDGSWDVVRDLAREGRARPRDQVPAELREGGGAGRRVRRGRRGGGRHARRRPPG